MNSGRPFAFGVLLFLFMATSTHAEEFAKLTGRFVVDGKVQSAPRIQQNVAPGVIVNDESIDIGPNGGLNNVVIYLRTKNISITPKYVGTANDDVVLEIKNLRFDPHLVILRTSQALKLVNSDGFNHNPKLNATSNPVWNQVLLVGATARQKLFIEEALPVRIDDTIHPWLKAWVLVRDSPYAAISSGDGTFAMSGLPVGVAIEFQLWHEFVGNLSKATLQGRLVENKGRLTLTTKPGDNSLGDITVPATMFRK